MDDRMKTISASASYICHETGAQKPLVGIVLGSGLGKLADSIEHAKAIPYRDITGFPESTATGHKGNFIYGTLGGKPVVAMQGRFHGYEGYPMSLVTMPIRVMKLMGVEYLFVSNAAGGANPDYRPGDLMIIKDHINLHPNPLIGPNFNEMGPRFPDMTCAYDLELIARAEALAAEMGIAVHKGIYLSSPGPTYETPAEVRYFRMIGADAIGMSTTPEVIVARHCGLRVFGMSVITNMCNTDNVEVNHNDGEDVVRTADAAADRMTLLFKQMIASL